MTSDRIPISKEGYDKLRAQLDQMKNEDMPRIAEQIAAARAPGAAFYLFLCHGNPWFWNHEGTKDTKIQSSGR